MKNILLLLGLSLFFAITASSQKSSLDFQSFEMGIQAGSSTLNGEVFSIPSLSLGLHATKPFSDWFALRATLSMNQLQGVNFYTSSTSLQSSRTINELNYSSFVNNYSTQLYDLSIEALRTANYSNIDLYLGTGLSYHYYFVRYDAKDAAGNLYDFTPVTVAIAARGDVSKSDLEIVNNILDGQYETAQLIDKSFEAFQSLGISVRAGMNYSISSEFKIGIDARWLLSLQDNLDGFRGASNSFFQNDQILSLNLTGSYVIGR